MRKIGLSLAICACVNACSAPDAPTNFRDLNKNGLLDAYEDSSRTVDDRVEDLLAQMTIAEKAGQMFINRAIVNPDASLEYKAVGGPRRLHAPDAIDQRMMSHFNIFDIHGDPENLARWHNNLQSYAQDHTRLGIPVTIASDPRHHFGTSIFAFDATGFSQFPDTLGFAAIGDAALVERFADIVREEYIAVGIRLALHPQIDLATEPRWSRINGGFGESADLSAEIAAAYVRGLQTARLGGQSVAAMTKHFPGGGPQNEGLDPHFDFQKGQIYPGNLFDYHLQPFVAAIEAGTASMMTYYGIPVGQTSEDVAMAFNRDIVTGLLRDKYGYDGIICADWGVITDIAIGDGVIWPARAWGVEHLDRKARVKKALDAGIDQFGGETATDLIVELATEGAISQQRIDASVRRVLRQKFVLGLFDEPFVDIKAVVEKLGRLEYFQLGHETQRRSLTLLKNADGVLPLESDNFKVFVDNLNAAEVAPFADVVHAPEDADFAIVRIETPWYPVETDNPIARGFHHGDLNFKGERRQELLDLAATVPTIFVIYLDRPAVIPDITASSVALLGEYGASDRAVAEVLFGVANPEGKLPFEMPSSMQAVREQMPDVPGDSKDPLFEYGFGLSYE